MMARRVRSVIEDLRQQFWAAVDSETVRLYEAAQYVLCFIAGLYMAVFSAPPSVHDALGVATPLFVWFSMLAPVVAYIASEMPIRLPFHCRWGKHRGEQCVLGDRYSGLWLAWGSSMTFGLCLTSYITAVVQESWGNGVYAAWMLIGLNFRVYMLAIRDIRKIGEIEHNIRMEP